MSSVALEVQKVKAGGSIHIRANGSIDPSDAPISSTDNITYTFTDNIYSSIVVERNNIIVDGNGYTLEGSGSGEGFNVTSVNNVSIKNTNIKTFGDGIYLKNSSYSTVSGNNITSNNPNGILISDSSWNNISRNNITTNIADGIRLYRSSNNSIYENNITNNKDYGIYFFRSSSNTIFGNDIANNDYGIRLQESSKYNSVSENNIIASKFNGIIISKSSRNKVSGNNVTGRNGSNSGIHLQESSDNTISRNNITNHQTNAGVYLYESSWNTVSGNRIANNNGGVSVWYSSNNAIYGNHLTDNNHSIALAGGTSSYNTIYRNNITNNNKAGISLLLSSNNKLYHNNFMNNTWHVNIQESGFANFWDSGAEGNYWSNYTGVDLDHDGIGNSPHILDANNIDNCPLMGIFSSFNISLGLYVNVISNSTIENFQYFESNSTVKMYVSNMTTDQTFGFCRVCIPKNLMLPPYAVVIDDGLTEVLYFNDTIYYNDTHRWIYFAYQHSTHEVDIVPEFPTLTSVLSMLIVLTVAIAISKRKLYQIQRQVFGSPVTRS